MSRIKSLFNIETLTIIFDEFIKALPSSLARLLGNAQ